MEENLDAPSKVQKLGHIIAGFNKYITDLQLLLNPSMPPEVVDVRKSTIKDTATQLEDQEKEAKAIIDATMQFWGSMV